VAIVTVFLAPGAFGAGGQFFDQNGNPLALGQIATYLAGTTTPAATYTGPGLTQAANANPIILNPDGRPPQEIWIPQGVAMKFTVADALGSVIGTYDNLTGVNDATQSVSEWVALNLAPTQLSSTSFSVPGNVTGILHADRRLLTVNAGGTLYGAVVSSSFGAGVTTVIVRMDTGQALDAGLSSVSYGFPSAFPGNTSLPMADTNPITGTTDATKRMKLNADRIASGQTRTLTMQDADLDVGDPGVCNARLTFTQGVPFPTADVTGANAVALFLQPVRGTRIALFDAGSSKWNIYNFTQAVTVAVPNVANQMYDVFAALSAGSVILEVVAWTNDTTRNVGLSVQDGVTVKATDFSRRYMGSFRTTAVAGQSEDSIAKRYLWNFYNRALRKMLVQETTATWTYTTATYRQANANAANQLDFVIGVQENIVKAEVSASASSSIVGPQVSIGIGIDSTTVNSADTFPLTALNGGTGTLLSAKWEGFAGIGRHLLQWLEISQASGTTTWNGNTAGALVTTHSGIAGEIWG
jgi:hypothetical protein